MQQAWLQWRIHRRIHEDTWWKVHGTPKGTFTNIWPPIHQRPPHHIAQVQQYGLGGQTFARTIKESIYIRVSNPTLNRNKNKYNLPHIYDGVLVNTSELQIRNQWELQHQQVHRTSLALSRTSRSYKIADILPKTCWGHSEWLVKACLKVIFCLYRTITIPDLIYKFNVILVINIILLM